VLLGCRLRRFEGAAHRWARFGRIHAGGDGRRAGCEYAGAVGVVTAISDRASFARLAGSRRGERGGVCVSSPILSAIRLGGRRDGQRAAGAGRAAGIARGKSATAVGVRPGIR